MARPMNDRQQRFVAEYLVDMNATQAAIRAGYTPCPLKLDFYVYLLVDPRDSTVFYVGKGSGNRVYVHEKYGSCNAIVRSRIARLHQLGHKVEHWIFSCDMLEDDALRLEMELIRSVPGIANVSHGTMPYRDWLAAEAESLYLEYFDQLSGDSFGEWILDEIKRQATDPAPTSAEIVDGKVRFLYERDNIGLPRFAHG